MNIDKVKISYSRYAPVYNVLFGDILQPGREALIKQIQTIQPSTVLEVGVGTGLLLPMYPSHIKVYGLDVSQAMLSKADALIKEKNLQNTSIAYYEGEKIPFPDHHFDCVTMPYVYSVTPDPIACLNECLRVCKPNGHILLLNHFSNTPEKSVWCLFEQLAKPFSNLVGFYSIFDYKQYVTNLNLPITSITPVNLFKLSRLITIQKQT